MADTISSDRRSKIMSHIKSKDTSIEMMVRCRLFAMGYRYRVNYKALPGKPDIVFTKKKIAIFFLLNSTNASSPKEEISDFFPVLAGLHAGRVKEYSPSINADAPPT